MAFVLDVNLRIKEILGLQKVEAALSKIKGSAQIGVAAAGGAAAGVAGAGGIAAGVKAQAAAATTLASATNRVTVANNKLVASQTKAVGSTRAVAAGMALATTKANSFGASVKIAGQRYAAFLAATIVPFAVLGGIAKATASVLEFDAAIVKIGQVMNRTAPQMAGLRDLILDLAASTGTSTKELTRVAQVLTQAGRRGDVLTESLTALSKVPLTPSFETMDAAIQGSIAALNQFRKEGLSTTEVLDVLTIVSNKFAASSEDIAKGISRGGAAFEAIGGTFREFVAIFTTVRQATRESAETIGTFMKTISSRLADPKIVDFLSGKGIHIGEAIEARNPVEAIKRIGFALENIVSVQDKIEIEVKLGGRRQISRLTALVSNLDVLDKVLNTTTKSAGEFGRVAEQGLKSLQAQLNILAQEMNKLVQSLAQPLFVPLIRGVTTLGKAFVSFIDVVKPVIPALTAIIGFAAGFKLLAISIGAAGKALVFMSTVGVGGGIPGVLRALSGAGAGGVAGATARERIQSRLAGGVGGAAVAGGFGARALSGARSAATSPLGQLAGAAALILTADKLSSAFEKAGNSTGLMVAEFVKAIGIIAVAASLISGKSIGEAITSFIGFMTPWGAAIGAAVVALGAFTFAATKAVDLDIQRIMDAIAKKVSKTKVPDIEAGDIDTLQKTVGGLGIDALSSIQETANRFDEDFSGIMAGVVARLGNLFEGEGLITISDADAQKMMKDIIGNNPALLNEIIRSAIEKFGVIGLESGLDKLLAEAFGGQLESASLVRQAMIKQAGGLSEIAKGIKQARLDFEVSKLANAVEKASNDFQTLRVPVQLSTELSLLSDAVGRTARVIDLNVRTFDKLSQFVGRGVGIPKPDTDFSREDIENLARTGQLKNLFNPDDFKNVKGFTTNIVDIGNALDDFFRSIIASKAQSDSLSTLLKTPLVDPFDVGGEFIDEFAKTLPEGMPPEAIALFKAKAGQMMVEIKSSLTEYAGLLPDSEIIAKIMKDAIGTETFFDTAVDVFMQWMTSQAEQLNLRLARAELFANIEVNTGKLAKTIADSLVRDLETIGIEPARQRIIRIGAGAKEGEQEIIKFGTDVELIDTVLNKLISTTEEYAISLRKVDGRTKDSLASRIALTQQIGKTGEEVLLLQSIFERLMNAVALAPQILTDIESRKKRPDEAGLQRARELSDEILEQANRTLQFAQAEIAADVSLSFVDSAQLFAKELVESTRVLKIFTSALTPEDIKKGFGVLGEKRTPEGRVFTERKPDPKALIDTPQQIGTRNVAQSAVFGGRMERVLETIGEVASTLASEKATRQAFGLGGGDFEGAASSRALANTLDEFDGFIFDILKIVRASSLDPGDVARATAISLQEQAQQPGIREVDFIGALNRTAEGLAKDIETLILHPSVARQPEKLVPGLSQGLQDTLRQLTPTPERIPEADVTPRVFEQISSSAVDIQQAAVDTRMAADATTQSTKEIIVASTDMKQGGSDMILASQVMSDSVSQMQVVADTQRETATLQLNASSAVSEGEGAREAIIQTTEAVNSLGERVDAITNAIDTQTQQAAELAIEKAEEPLMIEGLDENTEAIAVNNEVANKTQESISGLGDEMVKISGALEEGIGIDIETMSQVKVDVKGIASAAREFTSEFEDVAERMIKEQIRVVLQQLAAASGNSELTRTFESVL